MQSENEIRVLAQNRTDLLNDLAQGFGPAAGLRLLDAGGSEIWRWGGPGRATLPGGITVPIGIYGSLCLDGEPSTGAEVGQSRLQGMASALGRVLASTLEAELELNHLVDDHIATTNQLISLYNIIYGAGDSLDPADKFQIITDEACRQTQSEIAALRVEDAAHQGLFVSPKGSETEARARELLAAAAAENRARIDPDRRMVCGPVMAGDSPAGYLLIAGPGHPEGFKARDLKLVQAMSDLAARFLLTARLQSQALENLRLEQELEIACRIQELLVPRSQPDIPGLDVAAACIPASRIGGDFYTLRPLEDGGLAFGFGDVAGKGIPAALVMAMTRAAVASITCVYTDPGTVLRRLNEALFEDLERVGKFVTLTLGRFYPGECRVELANAGHSPVIQFAAGSTEPRVLVPEAPPLGVTPDLIAPTERMDLQGGGLLVVASDGLTEARSLEGEFFGLDRLARALGRRRGDDSRSLVRAVLSEVEEFAAGASQADDQTLLLLQGRRSP